MDVIYDSVVSEDKNKSSDSRKHHSSIKDEKKIKELIKEDLK